MHFETLRYSLFRVALVASAIVLAPPSQADIRVALIIGNGAYNSVPRLENPTRDAEAVASALRDVGFQSVQVASNLGRDGLLAALRKFEVLADTADWALIYYAGHGIEVGGINYLLPVDAKLRSDRDVDEEAVSLNQVQKRLEGARKLRIAILDACRDNPFIVSMKRTLASRAVGRGLARPELTQTGLLIAFAAAAGQTVSDGENAGGNSPYAAALVRNLAEPDVEVNLFFRRVRFDVLQATGQKQEPATYESLPADRFVFRPAPPAAPTPPAPKPPFASTLNTAAGTASLSVLPGNSSLDVRAQAFVQDYMRRSEGTVEDVVQFVRQVYAQDVTFYGKPISNGKLVEEKRRYLVRWPDRHFQLKPETTQVTCEAARVTCRITGELDYRKAGNKEPRVATGVAAYDLTVVFSQNGPRIIAESGRTLSRQN